ncbi:MAG: twin-arginine translocase TatA/TatE family subunit [Candidatus Palauibacterales bacterium]|nr:twin-arginine translocase TatA/TatE family subunit [Candidatus Palauibacterales bacterium]MDP2530943.1 twin-arginine translocase TatA/TatE family subunit [Candidatus Palauibacterales bacterium]MDP2583386.1 twin-arginine translocase TatA/TatE family subunit [Candidatus Palauibacterales bacterium]
MGIGSFGFSEMLVIVVLVLIFFGPQRMPEIARGLGKAMREFRKSMNEVKRELEQAGMADDSPAWKQDTRDIQPRPSGTIEPPHMTAGAPPSSGPEPAESSTSVDDGPASTTDVDESPAMAREEPSPPPPDPLA